MGNYEKHEERIITEESDRITPIRSDEVVVVQRKMSNGAIAAIVISAIAVAVLFTYVIVTNQQQQREADLALQRANQASTANDQQLANQPPAQQSPIIVTVPSQPVVVPAAPASQPSVSPDAPPSNKSLEVDVTSKLAQDGLLSVYHIDARVDTGGIVTLTGEVRSEDLRTRAADVAESVKGITRSINKIKVSGQS